MKFRAMGISCLIGIQMMHTMSAYPDQRINRRDDESPVKNELLQFWIELNGLMTKGPVIKNGRESDA